jgi:hypothetical protein
LRKAQQAQESIDASGKQFKLRSGLPMDPVSSQDLASLYDEAVSAGMRAQVIALSSMISNASGNSELRDLKPKVEGAQQEMVEAGILGPNVTASLLRLLPMDRFANVLSNTGGNFV